MNRPLACLLRRFVGDPSGAVAVIMGLAVLPVAGIVGAAVDYSRAGTVRAELQDALDAATLRSAHEQQLSDADLNRQIRAHIEAMLGNRYGAGPITLTVARNTGDNLLETRATVSVPTTIMSVMGFRTITVGVESAVTAEYAALEVALVLDNTGSMANRMGDLRRAAQDFVDIVTERGRSDQIRVGIVPYVASVNIGNRPEMRRFIDTGGHARFHADLIEWRWLAKFDWCSWSGGGGGGPNWDNSGGGQDGASVDLPMLNLPDIRLGFYADVFAQVLGVRAAHAFEPYTYNVTQGCYPRNPGQISNWQLFQQVGVQWKGCVEARPEPFDVTDTPPDPRNPDTLWVPYFWIDDSNRFASWAPQGNNDWIDDGPFIADTDLATNINGRTHSVLKYTTANAMRIDETPPSTRGPNMACGDPIQPLTNDYRRLTQHIANMRHWNNGGTQTAQGVAWGWRVLSPGEPFTEGAPYEDVMKVMVVMTDGVNDLVSSQNNAVLSDYSAYGHLRTGRMGHSIPEARRYIDSRTLAACRNAREAGVIVYTVTFGLRSADARRLWDECASERSMAYHVNTASELVGAFNSIATEVGDLRLTR